MFEQMTDPPTAKTQSVETRKQLVMRRFGNIPEGVLRPRQEMPRMRFPDITEMYEVNHRQLLYKKLDVNRWSGRIAEIYRRAIDEMVGVKHYEWHHHPEMIREKARSGDWAFYGVFLDQQLISVVSLFIHRSMYYIQWVWGCVDPEARGTGVWVNIGRYLDRVCRLSGAVYGRVWCATTHDLSQRTAESAGYVPHSIDFEFLGGSDGLGYLQPVVYYMKVYDHGPIMPRASMVMTDSVRELSALCPAVQ